MDRRTHLLIDCISHLPHSYSGITIRSFDFPDPPPENASYIRMIYAKKKNNIFLTFPLDKNFFFSVFKRKRNYEWSYPPILTN